MKKPLFALVALLMSVGFLSAQDSWMADPAHSKIGFSATHLVITEVRGQFDDFNVKVMTQGDDFSTAQIEFTAKVASINTGIEKRDNHLKSNDFFNAEKYPDISFKSTSMKKKGKGYKLTGNLTIRDVTKEVVLDVAYGGTAQMMGKTMAGFKITGTLNRFDYGLNWDKAIEAGGLVVSEEIELDITVEIAKM